MKRIIFLVLSFTIFAGISFAQLPEEYYQFRDYMYNFSKTPEEMEIIGEELLQKADKELAGYEKYLAKGGKATKMTKKYKDSIEEFMGA